MKEKRDIKKLLEEKGFKTNNSPVNNNDTITASCPLCGKDIIGKVRKFLYDIKSCGCIKNTNQKHRIIDIVGKTFGCQTVIRLSTKNKTPRTMWECVCKCGNISNVSYTNLKRNPKGCKICKTKTGVKNPLYKGTKNIPRVVYNHYKHGAETRKYQWNINIENLDEQLVKQHFKCALSGLDIFIGNNSKYKKIIGNASLDRIDSFENYNIDNIQWIHKDINILKQNYSNDYFIEICKLIFNPIKVFNKLNLVKYHSHSNWDGYGNISSEFFSRIKSGAEKRNIKFSLSIKDIWDLFLSQNGRCRYTGLDLTFNKKISKKFLPGTASLDRIESSQDYNINNVQWIHKHVNRMKLDYDDKYFKELMSLVGRNFTTVGCVSLFGNPIHEGHIQMINLAKSKCDILIVIINNDKQVELKNSVPFYNEQTRLSIIQNLSSVDKAIISIDEDESVSKTLELIKPNFFLNSGDRQTPNPKESAVCQEIGCRQIFELSPKVNSSSKLIRDAAMEYIRRNS